MPAPPWLGPSPTQVGPTHLCRRKQNPVVRGPHLQVTLLFNKPNPLPPWTQAQRSMLSHCRLKAELPGAQSGQTHLCGMRGPPVRAGRGRGARPSCSAAGSPEVAVLSAPWMSCYCDPACWGPDLGGGQRGLGPSHRPVPTAAPQSCLPSPDLGAAPVVLNTQASSQRSEDYIITAAPITCQGRFIKCYKLTDDAPKSWWAAAAVCPFQQICL